MFRLRRNQVCTSRNWKPSQREILSKDAGPFLNFVSSPGAFLTYLLKQIKWLVSPSVGYQVWRIFLINIYFLNVNIYVSINDCLFKYVYLLCYVKFRFYCPTFSCNVEFEFSWFRSYKKSSEILIIKTECCLNFKIDEYWNYWVLINDFEFLWIRQI